MSKAYVVALQNVPNHGVCFFFFRELARIGFFFRRKYFTCTLRCVIERSSRAHLFGVIHRCIPSAYSLCTLYRRGCVSASSLSKATRDGGNLNILSPSDFLSNVLLLRILNSGISDSGLIAHLPEATAGSLNSIRGARDI